MLSELCTEMTREPPNIKAINPTQECVCYKNSSVFIIKIICVDLWLKISTQQKPPHAALILNV